MNSRCIDGVYSIPFILIFCSPLACGNDAIQELAMSCPFQVWLGPQRNSGSLIGPNGELRIKAVVVSKEPLVGRTWEKIKGNMQIEMQATTGSRIKLPDTANGYTTLVNGEVGSIRSVSDLQIKPESMYIVSVVRHKERFKRYYSLNVRIMSGPLEGAIVHLCNDNHVDSLKDPYVAIYKIPGHIKASEEALEYKVVRIFRK